MLTWQSWHTGLFIRQWPWFYKRIHVLMLLMSTLLVPYCIPEMEEKKKKFSWSLHLRVESFQPEHVHRMLILPLAGMRYWLPSALSPPHWWSEHPAPLEDPLSCTAPPTVLGAAAPPPPAGCTRHNCITSPNNVPVHKVSSFNGLISHNNSNAAIQILSSNLFAPALFYAAALLPSPGVWAVSPAQAPGSLPLASSGTPIAPRDFSAFSAAAAAVFPQAPFLQGKHKNAHLAFCDACNILQWPWEIVTSNLLRKNQVHLMHE